MNHNKKYGKKLKNVPRLYHVNQFNHNQFLNKIKILNKNYNQSLIERNK